MHATQTYAYDMFLIWIAGLPLYVPCVWSLLLVHAYDIAHFRKEQHPQVSIGLLSILWGMYVLSYDFIIDVVAVDIGMWTWFLNPDQWRYGVSYGNFFGRFVVATIFLYVMLRTKSYVKTLLISICLQTAILVWPFFLFPHDWPNEQLFSLWFLLPQGIVLAWSLVYTYFSPWYKDMCPSHWIFHIFWLLVHGICLLYLWWHGFDARVRIAWGVLCIQWLIFAYKVLQLPKTKIFFQK